MSSRRTRVKGVISLPPRRKNNDNEDKNKSTQITPAVEEEKLFGSPKPAPSPSRCLVSEKKSPIKKIVSPIKSPHINTKEPAQSTFKISQDLERSSKVVSAIKSPPYSSRNISQTPTILSSVAQKEKLKGDVTDKSPPPSTSWEGDDSVFLSPRSVFSPLKRPTVPQPSVIDLGIQRMKTPERVVEMPKYKISNNWGVDKSADIAVHLNKNDAPDDYNVLSVPESLTEVEEMDGIIPLQAAATTPKPIALLKDELISDNVEVLFDPIVPLPSPSKVRPKLRPIPRLNPLRRNSIQGSASESEDESRRALLTSGSVTPGPPRQRADSHTSVSTMLSLPNREVSRVRNDSVCSSVSQIAGQPTTSTSPVKEKGLSKSRRQEMSRRMLAMRRRREMAKKDVLTMYDLIFYNPTENPFVPNEEEIKAKEANEKVGASSKSSTKSQEYPDDPPAESAAPVPQIKLGPNGEIILDEKSLMINQSANRKISSVVVEGAWSAGGSGRYRRGPRTADWSDPETVRFYRALAALGTDFMLMERLFPGRTRRDLKLKFKKEERVNGAQVDKALRTSCKWDATKLEKEFAAEREEAKNKARIETERLKAKAKEDKARHKVAKELRVRQSKASKAMDASMLPDAADDNLGLTADDFIRRHLENKVDMASKRKPKITPISNPTPLIPIAPDTNSQYAQLTSRSTPIDLRTSTSNEMATLLKMPPMTSAKTPELINNATGVPSNIETGSLVVLTVDDPKSPTKKMLQTYIAHGGGKLTPIALPPNLLNSVVSYMKKGTQRNNISDSSSPCSVLSYDSRSNTPGVIVPSPSKRQRLSSYTITPL